MSALRMRKGSRQRDHTNTPIDLERAGVLRWRPVFNRLRFELRATDWVNERYADVSTIGSALVADSVKPGRHFQLAKWATTTRVAKGRGFDGVADSQSDRFITH